MYDKFPRQIAFPMRKLVYNKKEFLKYINRLNGKMNLGTNVYDYQIILYNNGKEEVDYSSAIVDKLFFDVDGPESYNDMIKLHKYCVTNNYKHIIAFSGQGFHIYIFIKPTTFLYPKSALLQAHKFLIIKLNLKSVDNQHLSDLTRMGRIFNTYNIRRKMFCITLTKQNIKELDYEGICELAKKQKETNDVVMNQWMFDISRFDTKPHTHMKIEENKYKLDSDKVIINEDKFPPCIRKMLLEAKHKRLHWNKRGQLIIFLRDKGYLLDECLTILKHYLSDDEYNHCVKEDKDLFYLYKAHNLLFKSCDVLMQEEICPGKCKMYDKVLYL